MHDAPKNPRHYLDELNIHKQIYIQSIYQLIYTDTYAKPLFARASIKTTLCMAHDNNTNISIAKQPKKKRQIKTTTREVRMMDQKKTRDYVQKLTHA